MPDSLFRVTYDISPSTGCPDCRDFTLQSVLPYGVCLTGKGECGVGGGERRGRREFQRDTDVFAPIFKLLRWLKVMHGPA